MCAVASGSWGGQRLSMGVTSRCAPPDGAAPASAVPGALCVGYARRQSAQISRLLCRLHVYGLVAKIPRSRRWRVTAFGHRVMGASVRLRQLHFPTFYAKAA